MDGSEIGKNESVQASWGHFLGQARKWLKGYLRTRLFGYSVIRGFGYSGIRLFGYWVIRVFGYLRMRLFGSSRERIRIRSIICKFMHYAEYSDSQLQGAYPN